MGCDMWVIPEIKISRRSKVVTGIVLVLILAGLCLAAFFYLRHSMYRGNPRMTMMHLQVISGGWWNNRGAEVERLLSPPGAEPAEGVSLKIGSTNLFELDLARIRLALEKEPEIARAKVERVLPDTLKITLQERIPRAVLSNRSGDLIDEDGIILPRWRAAVSPASLPLIYGLKGPFPPRGEKLDAAIPAIEMIMLTLRSYQEIRVISADISKQDHILVRIVFRNRGEDTYRVLINREKVAESMDVLITAIRDIKRKGAPGRVIDLRIPGQIVLKSKL